LPGTVVGKGGRVLFAVRGVVRTARVRCGARRPAPVTRSHWWGDRPPQEPERGADARLRMERRTVRSPGRPHRRRSPSRRSDRVTLPRAAVRIASRVGAPTPAGRPAAANPRRRTGLSPSRPERTSITLNCHTVAAERVAGSFGGILGSALATSASPEARSALTPYPTRRSRRQPTATGRFAIPEAVEFPLQVPDRREDRRQLAPQPPDASTPAALLLGADVRRGTRCGRQRRRVRRSAARKETAAPGALPFPSGMRLTTRRPRCAARGAPVGDTLPAPSGP
jgi:hypothetical protein